MAKFKTLLLAHHGGDNHAIRFAVEQFSERVTQRSGGQLAIATVPNSSLGNVAELLQLAIDGTADMVFAPYDRLAASAPRFGCVAMPFLFDDHAHVDRVLDAQFAAWVEADLEAPGLVCLGHWEWGFRQLTNSLRPVLTPADMRGLKIRVPQVLPYRPLIVAFGATPVMVEFSRLANVLEQGLIDGQENPVSVIHSLGLQHTQKYLSLLNHSYGALAHVINRNCFDRLGSEQQSILIDESQRAGALLRSLGRSQEQAQLDSFASQGVRIDRPDLAPFKALMQPVYREVAKSCGERNFGEFLAMVEAQRKLPAAVT